MKILNKTVLGLILLSMLISVISVYNTQTVLGAKDDEKVNIDDGDRIQTQIKSEDRVRFRFREQTRLTLECNERCNVSIDCDAKRIGDKDFEIEIETDDPMNLTMRAREERNTLGLRYGNTFEVRNRNRVRYQEGFVVDIESSEDDIEAKLRIEENEQNRGGSWAYYDEKNEEWVTVETTSNNGYLECETDHFSTWTILVPEISTTMYIIIASGIGAVILVAVVFIYLRRRK
jgi:hypothetical protein